MLTSALPACRPWLTSSGVNGSAWRLTPVAEKNTSPFSELPPLQVDQVYLHDLIGMRAVSASGEELGTVTTFYELPQGLMLDINTRRGSVLIPYRPEIVIQTDIVARTILINDTLGLMDNYGGEE